MGSNGLDQQAANSGIAVRAIDDDVEDHGFVNIVGEHARKGGETSGAAVGPSSPLSIPICQFAKIEFGSMSVPVALRSTATPKS